MATGLALEIPQQKQPQSQHEQEKNNANGDATEEALDQQDVLLLRMTGDPIKRTSEAGDGTVGEETTTEASGYESETEEQTDNVDEEQSADNSTQQQSTNELDDDATNTHSEEENVAVPENNATGTKESNQTSSTAHKEAPPDQQRADDQTGETQQPVQADVEEEESAFIDLDDDEADNSRLEVDERDELSGMNETETIDDVYNDTVVGTTEDADDDSTTSVMTDIDASESTGSDSLGDAKDVDLQQQQQSDDDNITEVVETQQQQPSSVNTGAASSITNGDATGEAEERTLQEQLQQEYPKPHCDVWGGGAQWAQGRRRRADLEVLSLLFQDMVLSDSSGGSSGGESMVPEQQTSMDELRMSKQQQSLLQMMNEEASNSGSVGRILEQSTIQQSSSSSLLEEEFTIHQEEGEQSPKRSANEEFVQGLDDIDKFFEDVEPPDELDVGADGSSIQEVLMGQGSQILRKRLFMGLKRARRYIVQNTKQLWHKATTSHDWHTPTKEELVHGAQWIWDRAVQGFETVRDVVDDIFDGDGNGGRTGVGSDSDDKEFQYEPVLPISAKKPLEEQTTMSQQQRQQQQQQQQRYGSPGADPDEEIRRLIERTAR